MARRATIMLAAGVAAALAGAAPAAADTPLPDLTVKRSGPKTAYVQAPYTETLTVTNAGTATAPGVVVDYAPGGPTVSAVTAGAACDEILQGHSGRGGGYHRVGWACHPSLPAGLAPGATVTVKIRVVAPSAGVLAESYVVKPQPDTGQLGLVSHTATASVNVVMPALPGAPVIGSAVQTHDQVKVGWTPDAATAKAITSSTITATPTGGSTAPVVTSTVAGTAHSGLTGELQPDTPYDITVTSRDAAGPGPASAPWSFRTKVSTVVPGVPKNVTARWIADFGTNLLVAWTGSVPGDSPVDAYQASATRTDAGDAPRHGATTFTTTVDGSAREATFAVDASLDWAVQVRAHDAAGWSAWSPKFVLPALL